MQILGYLGNTPKYSMSKKLTQICLTFCMVHAAVANFGMHAGKKFSTQNEECMSISISIFCQCIGLYIMCNKNMLTITEKIYQEIKFTT